MLLFSLDTDPVFSNALAATLGVPLAPHEERRFDDGEFKLRPLVDPCGADAFVVHGLYGDAADSPHDKLMRLLMFVGTLRAHGAARVTAVVPYLAYARKDRQTKPFDPVSLHEVARLFSAVGTAQIIVLEVHNVAAYQNAFECPTLHLDVHPVFDPIVASLAAQGTLVAASPDPGGVKRAQVWREALAARLSAPVGFAMVDKRRSAGVVSSEHRVAGDVAGSIVLLLDDLISSGGTMREAATALRRAGAARVVAFAAHGLFTGGASEQLPGEALAEVVVADSVPAFRVAAGSPLRARLRIVSAAPLFAQAIRRCADGWRR